MCLRALQYKGKLVYPKAFEDQVNYLLCTHIYHPEDKPREQTSNCFWLCHSLIFLICDYVIFSIIPTHVTDGQHSFSTYSSKMWCVIFHLRFTNKGHGEALCYLTSSNSPSHTPGQTWSRDPCSWEPTMPLFMGHFLYFMCPSHLTPLSCLSV